MLKYWTLRTFFLLWRFCLESDDALKPPSPEPRKVISVQTGRHLSEVSQKDLKRLNRIQMWKKNGVLMCGQQTYSCDELQSFGQASAIINTDERMHRQNNYTDTSETRKQSSRRIIEHRWVAPTHSSALVPQNTPCQFPHRGLQQKGKNPSWNN